MLRDITFGQYYDTSSPLHRTDPRIKMVSMVLLIVFIFMAGNTWSMLFATLAIGLILLVSRVPSNCI